MTDREFSSTRQPVIVIACVAGVLLLLAATLFWRPQSDRNPPKHGDTPQQIPSPEYSELLKTARDAQLKGDWCAARTAFQELKDKLTSDQRAPEYLRDEVERNQRMLLTLCPEDVPSLIPIPDGGVAVPVPPKKHPPEKLPEEMLLERYPIGKTIRSVGHFNASGRGRNKAWGLQGEVSFSYLAQVPAETRVVETDARAGRLVFEQSFGEVVQIRAASNQTLQFVPPDSLVVRTVWPKADQQLKRRSPGYLFVRNLADALNAADPGLKKTLTTASEWLRRAGVNVTPETPDTELAVRVEKLSGSKMKFVYVSGLGVTQISQMDGVPFNRDELIRLAHASTVLVDYFVFPTAKRRVGEKWNVRADDVGDLFALYDPSSEIGGTIGLQREKDEIKDQIAMIKVIDGTVTATTTVDGKEQRGRLTVRDGKMSFDLKQMYVRVALFNFSASTLLQSRDHLLFGTEQMRDLKIESRYEAELVTPAASQP